MNGQASLHSEWMKVSTTTWPRSWSSVTRLPRWSTSVKFGALRLAGISGPTNCEDLWVSARPWRGDPWPVRITTTIAPIRPTRTTDSTRWSLADESIGVRF
jgi:hypothetical protein